MNRFNKFNHCHIPCAFPIPPIGPTGPTGITGPGVVPFANAIIDGPQIIPPLGSVTLGVAPNATNDITFFNQNTLIINTPGVYVIIATLNFAPGQRADSTISFLGTGSISGFFGGLGNADTVGPITDIELRKFQAGDTIQLINRNTDTSITIIDGIIDGGILQFSAGRLIVYKISELP
ncbi:hypothetical protein IKC_06436 [Bacillus cereus VD184]|uniref:Exosporium leader peptide n=1 Tax=Bacillus cereus VD184 TaxID=1053242 RepID=A0A9W5R248_BACCE|nr:hypothetical protein IKC_06436 [Bacillus cereus VD184]